MSRIEWSAQRTSAFAPVLRGALALGIAAAGGCSADVTRFDVPMFGLTESGGRTAYVPVPREDVRMAERAAAPEAGPGTGTPYGNGGGYGPPPGRMAALPEPRYEPAPQGGTYPQAPWRQVPSDQPVYRQQPGYQPAPYPAYPAAPAAEPRAATEPASQPPQAYRTVPVRPVVEPVRPVAEPPAAVAPPAPPARATESRPAAAGGGGESIEVQPGDTLFGLASRYNISISELMSVNGLRNPTLQPGQKLVIPPRTGKSLAARRPLPATETASVPAAAPPAAAAPVALPAPAPAATGPGLPAAGLAVSTGAAPATTADSASTYTVRSGDSLYGIAVRHKVALADLQRLNGIADPTKVMPGAVLKIPASAARPTVADAPAIGPPAAPAAPQGAAPPATPTIINAPATRLAALESKTASDADPSPAAAPVRVPPVAEQPPPAAHAAAGDRQPEAAPRAREADAAAAAKLRWPVRGKIIAAFGPRPDGQHNDGIKLAVPLGTEVHAAEAGVVAYAGSELKGYGNLVLLRHDNGWITAYAHNDSLAVRRGDRVSRGQVIAKAGKTGTVDQPQVHFELRQGSSPVDPVPYLERL